RRSAGGWARPPSKSQAWARKLRRSGSVRLYPSARACASRANAAASDRDLGLLVHQLAERLVADLGARDEQAAVHVVAEVGAVGPRPPALQDVLLAVADHHQVRLDLARVGADLLRRLAADQLAFDLQAEAAEAVHRLLEEVAVGLVLVGHGAGVGALR